MQELSRSQGAKTPLRGGKLPAPGLTHAPQQHLVLSGGFAYELWGQCAPRPWAVSRPRSALERVGLFPFSDSAGLQWVNCSHDYSIRGREAGQAKYLADLGMEGLSPYLVDF